MYKLRKYNTLVLCVYSGRCVVEYHCNKEVDITHLINTSVFHKVHIRTYVFFNIFLSSSVCVFVCVFCFDCSTTIQINYSWAYCVELWERSKNSRTCSILLSVEIGLGGGVGWGKLCVAFVFSFTSAFCCIYELYVIDFLFLCFWPRSVLRRLVLLSFTCVCAHARPIAFLNGYSVGLF